MRDLKMTYYNLDYFEPHYEIAGRLSHGEPSCTRLGCTGWRRSLAPQFKGTG